MAIVRFEVDLRVEVDSRLLAGTFNDKEREIVVGMKIENAIASKFPDGEIVVTWYEAGRE